jgi:hypothetical protein
MEGSSVMIGMCLGVVSVREVSVVFPRRFYGSWDLGLDHCIFGHTMGVTHIL